MQHHVLSKMLAAELGVSRLTVFASQRKSDTPGKAGSLMSSVASKAAT